MEMPSPQALQEIYKLHFNVILAFELASKNKAFIELLMSMPDVGKDSDFERIDDSGRTEHIFD